MAAVGSAFCWPAMSGAEPWTGSNMDGRGAVHVEVAGGGEADPAGDGRREVGDDVAEQVVGDDHVEAGRVGDHEDRGGVDVQVVVRDVGELLGHGLDRALPELAGEDQDVVLVHEGELLAGAVVGPAEGVADHALHAVGGVQRHLGGHLVGGAGAQRAAVAHVGALGAFADDDEVDLAGVRERAADAGVQAGGPQVDEVVQAEAQLQQELALDDAGGDPGVAGGRADGAEQDGVAGAEVGEGGRGQGLPRREPVLRTQLVVGLLEHDPFCGRGLFKDLQGFGGDLRADAVARDDCQINRGCAHIFRVAK